MQRNVVGSILLAVLLLGSGCATQLRQEPWVAKVVTARSVVAADEVYGITDQFTAEGRIYVHVAFTGTVLKPPSPRSIQVKWFNGNSLVFERTAQYTFDRSPYYIWAGTSGTALGYGNCRVEVYSDGQLVGTHSFTVTKK